MYPPIHIARQGSTALGHMPSTATITRTTGGGQDEYGYTIPSTTTTTTTRCRLSGLSADEAQVAGRISSSASAKVVLPLGTDITSADTLEVDGAKWHISGVMPRSEALAAHTVVLVARAS